MTSSLTSSTDRRSRRTIFLVLTILVTIAGHLPGQPVKKGRVPALPFGEPLAERISVVGELPVYQGYDLVVTDEIFAIGITISGAPADLDLLLYDDANELIAYSEYPLYNEELMISRISDYPLESGRYRLEVAYQYSRPPRPEGVALTEIPFTLTVDAVRPATETRLRPGRNRQGRLVPEEGMIRIYRIDVPSGTQVLRIDLSESDADLDLFLRKDYPAVDPFLAEYWSQSVRSTEVLIVDESSAPPLTGGTYYATVIDQISNHYPADFRISVHSGRDAPEHLLRETTPPVAVTPLDRPLRATVEILSRYGGGSGVIVDPRGYILTNYHVVLSDSGEPADNLTVGISSDYGRPPEERYLAEVVDTAEDRDLALLRITSGRYGEALPQNPRFVYLEPRFDDIPEIGESLRFIGYPSIGGTGSRASITYTRGTVAGYQDVPFGRLIKTDAEINEGSSGGAALDEAFRLVGMPTEVVGLDAGQLAYIYPVTAIPEEWRRLLRR